MSTATPSLSIVRGSPLQDEPGQGAQLMVQYVPQTNVTRVMMDANGDGRVDGMIRLSGQLSLTEADFIL